jgi:hypothetical protein
MSKKKINLAIGRQFRHKANGEIYTIIGNGRTCPMPIKTDSIFGTFSIMESKLETIEQYHNTFLNNFEEIKDDK